MNINIHVDGAGQGIRQNRLFMMAKSESLGSIAE